MTEAEQWLSLQGISGRSCRRSSRTVRLQRRLPFRRVPTQPSAEPAAQSQGQSRGAAREYWRLHWVRQPANRLEAAFAMSANREWGSKQSWGSRPQGGFRRRAVRACGRLCWGPPLQCSVLSGCIASPSESPHHGRSHAVSSVPSGSDRQACLGLLSRRLHVDEGIPQRSPQLTLPRHRSLGGSALLL